MALERLILSLSKDAARGAGCWRAGPSAIAREAGSGLTRGGSEAFHPRNIQRFRGA